LPRFFEKIDVGCFPVWFQRKGYFMVLAVTGSPVLIGNDTIGHVEFLPTNMDAVDADGQATGETLHIMRAPLTEGSRGRINNHLLAQGLTHGVIAIYRDGTAHVMGRETQDHQRRVLRAPVMEKKHHDETVLGIKSGILFYPDSSLVLADPDFAAHPAVNMTWYEGASLAAALEDADPRFRVRMMRSPEYNRFVIWDSKYTEATVKARAHLFWEGIEGTASVEGGAVGAMDASGNILSLRTTEEGFVDPFGNVQIWLDESDGIVGEDLVDSRMMQGSSFLFRPRDAYVFNRFSDAPHYFDEDLGVRFVAIRRR
jgi:hypothetical protein